MADWDTIKEEMLTSELCGSDLWRPLVNLAAGSQVRIAPIFHSTKRVPRPTQRPPKPPYLPRHEPLHHPPRTPVYSRSESCLPATCPSPRISSPRSPSSWTHPRATPSAPNSCLNAMVSSLLLAVSIGRLGAGRGSARERWLNSGWLLRSVIRHRSEPTDLCRHQGTCLRCQR